MENTVKYLSVVLPIQNTSGRYSHVRLKTRKENGESGSTTAGVGGVCLGRGIAVVHYVLGKKGGDVVEHKVRDVEISGTGIKSTKEVGDYS